MKRQTRVPRSASETIELLARAEELLRSSRESFVVDGIVPRWIDYGGGTYGDLREAAHHEHDRSGVRVYRPSQIERESAQAWHDYCAEHGYPTGERAGMTNGYPPHPVHDGNGEWIELTWGRVRSLLRAGPVADRDEQLELFEVAA